MVNVPPPHAAPVQLLYFFRKQHSGFSIEGLFSHLSAYVSTRFSYTVGRAYVPHMTLRPHTLWANLRMARQQQAEAYHITGDVHYLMLALPPTRTVLTIHDCVSLERQRAAGNWVRYGALWLLFYYLPMRQARYITTVSEKSKQELARLVGARLARKVRVVPNYVNPRFRPSAAGTFNELCPRVLQVGTNTHKNLPRLIQALTGIPCMLVIVGRLSSEQQTYLATANIRYETKERLTDNELVAEYERCDLVTFVSTYEGFGLPILEANAVGRPVLTANISPLREVASDAACLADPYSVSSIRAGLQQIIGHAPYRDQLIRAGFENVKKYSLKQVAGQYLGIYQQILDR